MISPLPGFTADQARVGHQAACPGSSPTSSTSDGQLGALGRWRVPRHHRALAGDGPDHPWRRPSVTSTPIGPGFAGRYFPGTGAKRDEDGYFWLLGRVDDIMLVSGHNISTTEVESALVSHARRGRSGGGRPDRRRSPARPSPPSSRCGAQSSVTRPSSRSCADHVANVIGPIAKPKSIVFTVDLPKTRSGKIMRRLLKDISEHRQLGDVTTLANADIVAEIAEKAAVSTTD